MSLLPLVTAFSDFHDGRQIETTGMSGPNSAPDASAGKSKGLSAIVGWTLQQVAAEDAKDGLAVAQFFGHFWKSMKDFRKMPYVNMKSFEEFFPIRYYDFACP